MKNLFLFLFLFLFPPSLGKCELVRVDYRLSAFVLNEKIGVFVVHPIGGSYSLKLKDNKLLVLRGKQKVEFPIESKNKFIVISKSIVNGEEVFDFDAYSSFEDWKKNSGLDGKRVSRGK